MTFADSLVYVIDDDISMLKAIGRLLDTKDYSVEMFTGAREFLARVPHIGPSCLILDLNLPGLNGLQLQQALAERGLGEQIIFITGGPQRPDLCTGDEAGAVDYLSKPFDEDLLCALEQALTRSPEQWLQRSSAKRCMSGWQR